jgi:hypothetical protein
VLDLSKPKDGFVNDTVLKEIPKVLLAFVLGLSGSALGVGLVSWRDLALTGQSVGDLERRVSDVEVLASAVATENVANSLAREDFKFAINKLHDSLDKLKDAVSDLKSKPGSRPDPFTGSEGRELEERIRALERNNP